MPKGVYIRTEKHRQGCREGCSCGRHLVTEGQRQRISEALTGTKLPPRSEEQLQNMSESQKGRKSSLETCQRISEVQKGMYRGIVTTGHYVGKYWELCNQFEHPLSRRGQLLEHRYVLWNKLGCTSLDCEHLCYWGCGKILTWGGQSGICADHLDGNGLNNDPANLVESCVKCNAARSNAGNPINWSRAI